MKVEELAEETKRRSARVERNVNTLFLVGLIAMVIGFYLMWHPLGWIIGGALFVAFAAILHNESTKKINNQ